MDTTRCGDCLDLLCFGLGQPWSPWELCQHRSGRDKASGTNTTGSQKDLEFSGLYQHPGSVHNSKRNRFWFLSLLSHSKHICVPKPGDILGRKKGSQLLSYWQIYPNSNINNSNFSFYTSFQFYPSSISIYLSSDFLTASTLRWNLPTFVTYLEFLPESPQAILFQLFDLVQGFTSIKFDCNKLTGRCMCKAQNFREVIKWERTHMASFYASTEHRFQG